MEPRGVEPRSQDFQSCAYTKSAKVPFWVAPDGFEPPPPDPESDVLTITPWSNLVMREGLEPTTRCFVDNCSNPTELPHHYAEAEGFEPPEPFGSTR